MTAPAAASGAGEALPVAVVGAGPVGLIAALGLAHHGVPVVVVEEDGGLSQETKAGTVLTRTLEVLRRYGALDGVLRAAMRVDEIGDLDRATNERRHSIRTGALTEDTRLPFVVNVPQHHLEPVLRTEFDAVAPGALRLRHRLVGFEQGEEAVRLRLETPDGERAIDARYLLACDGGRSTVRELLGVEVEGKTIPERYMLIDLEVDLDVANARDYPYLAYFGDPDEWMILVRQPHCWRFLFPLDPGQPEPSQESLVERARRFIGEVDEVEVLGSNVYPVHQRVATSWRQGRVLLMGDAAHLLTPMWALGLNTGVLDASNVAWRLAWILRGWADEALLDGYEREQRSLAIEGAGAMAEAARAHMHRRQEGALEIAGGEWGVAFTRTLLGVRLDLDGSGEWSIARDGQEPGPVRAGDRAPDLPLHGPDGIVHVHDLCSEAFVALHFRDARRRPSLPPDSPALRHRAVSRWDAPPGSALRARLLLDPGDRVRRRFGFEGEAVVLLRPDEHVAAIVPSAAGEAEQAERVYEELTGRAVPAGEQVPAHV